VAVATTESFLKNQRHASQLTLARGFTGEDEPTCHCNCCAVAKRLPAETIGPTDVKCIENLQEFGCSDVCKLPTPFRVIENSNIILMSQYCFLECKPIDDVVATQCMALTPEEVARARTDDGNGEDVNPLPHKYMPKKPKPTPAPPPPEPKPAPEKPKEEKPRDAPPKPRPKVETKVVVTDEAIFEALMHKVHAEAQDHANTMEEHIRAAWDHANEAKEQAQAARDLHFG